MPTGEETPEPTETPQETSEQADIEDVPNDIKVEEVVVKRGKAKASAKPKASSAAKAAAKQDKVDLKTKIPCPICKKGPYTLHHLMYTHQCTKEARAARSARVEEHALSEVLVPALERPPPRPLDTPDVEPAPSDAGRAAAPPPPPEPPPLVRQSAVPPPTNSIRDKLVERRFALDAARRAVHSGPIRRFYGK